MLIQRVFGSDEQGVLSIPVVVVNDDTEKEYNSNNYADNYSNLITAGHCTMY